MKSSEQVEPDYQALFESGMGAFVVLSPRHVIIAATDEYLQLTKTKRENIIGKQIFDVFPDNINDPSSNGSQSLTGIFNQVIQSKKPFAVPMVKYDLPVQTGASANFEEHFWSLLITPVIGNNGQVSSITLRVAEVSDDPRFEALRREALNLQRTEYELRLCQRVAKVGTFEWNIADNKHKFSPEFEALYGEPPGGLKNSYENWARRVHPLDMARIVEDAQSALTTGEFQGRWRVTWPDGSIRWLAARASVFRDSNGKPTHMLGANFDITERIYVEESQARLAAIIESSEDAIISQGLDGSVLTWNDSAERIFGYTAQEMIGRPLSILTPADRADEDQENILNVQSGLKVKLFETHRLTKTGKKVIVSLAISPIRNSQGQIIGTSEVYRDMSAHKQAQAALDDSILTVKTLERALDAHALVAITDRAGKIIYVNETFCEVSKYSREELLGQDHRIINSGHHPKSFFTNLWQTISSGQIWKGEIRNRAKDGTYYWVATTIVPFLDARGVPYQYVAIRADITQKKHAEDMLRHSQESLSEAQRIADIGNWEWSPETDTPYWSDQMFKIFGLDAKAPAANYAMVEKLYDPDDWVLLNNAVNDALQQSKPYEIECRITRPDGSQRWVSSRGEPVYDRTGKVTGLRGTVQDITVRREAEDSVRKLNATLEQRVLERTEQLDSSNQELRAFSYSVSHDLRAPLRGIDGWSQALEEDCGNMLDATGREYLTRVRSETQRMGHLIDDLLKLSRITQTQLMIEDVNLSQIAAESVTRLKESDKTRQVQVIVKPDVHISADKGLIRAVMTNLLDNAWKFTAKNSHAKIEFGVRTQDHELQYFVQDNGAGFDMAYAPKLFTPFQRLHRASEFPGTGIGLAIVHRAIKRHMGRIWAESEPGKGATFYFTLGTVE